MIKMLGQEWIEFYSDPSVWPIGSWHDGETILVNGKETDCNFDLTLDVKNDDKITLDGGALYINEDDKNPFDLEKVFKQWRKTKLCVRYIITVPNEHIKLVQETLRSISGVKINKV